MLTEGALSSSVKEVIVDVQIGNGPIPIQPREEMDLMTRLPGGGWAWSPAPKAIPDVNPPADTPATTQQQPHPEATPVEGEAKVIPEQYITPGRVDFDSPKIYPKTPGGGEAAATAVEEKTQRKTDEEIQLEVATALRKDMPKLDARGVLFFNVRH